MMGLGAYDDDDVSFDGGASVASSDWANLSFAGSTTKDLLLARDIANHRELWEVWSNNQCLTRVNAESETIDHSMSQIISGVFKLSCHIPHLWLYVQPASHDGCIDPLQQQLVQIAQHNPGFFEKDDASAPLDNDHAWMLAEAALAIHKAALRVAQNESERFSDDVWASEVHDALIIGCAKGRLLWASRAWDLPMLHPDTSNHPAISQLAAVRKLRPRGAKPILCPGENQNQDRLFAAAFSTRSDIASYWRDTPEDLALHAFSNIATGALLTQLAELGINMPVFGVMCDRNIVRFHVDWSVALPNGHDRGTASLSLPYPDHPDGTHFVRELDMTRLDDALRVAFMLDAINAYAQHVLAPAVLASTMNFSKLRLSQGEITSEEKVAAWIHYEDADPVVEPISYV